MTHAEDRHKLVISSLNFFKTIEKVYSVVSGLLEDYKCNEDFCGADQVNISNETIKNLDVGDEYALSCQISKHHEQKEGFLKACTHARRNAENFLKYISRCIQYYSQSFSSTAYKNAEIRVKTIMDDLLKQENQVLEYWAEKKKRLDHCKTYVLVEHSSKQALKSINEKGFTFIESKQAYLNEEHTKEELNEVAKEFSDFNHYVVECKLKVSLLTQLADNLIEKGHSHEVAIKKWVSFVDNVYKDFYVQLDRYKSALNNKQGLFASSQDSESIASVSSQEEQSSSTKTNSLKEIISQSSENRKSVRKKDFILAELLHTERTYVEDLKLCIDTYLHEFRCCNQLPISLVGKESQLFGNIEKIYDFHNK